jgi:hypothetical protein
VAGGGANEARVLVTEVRAGSGGGRAAARDGEHECERGRGAAPAGARGAAARGAWGLWGSAAGRPRGPSAADARPGAARARPVHGEHEPEPVREPRQRRAVASHVHPPGL